MTQRKPVNHTNPSIIILFHSHEKPIYAYDYTENKKIDINSNESIFQNLKILAQKNPESFIGWCLHDLKNFLQLDAWKNIFHHRFIWVSYALNKDFYFHKKLGFVDNTIFLKLNKNVTYPTWISSSDVGATSAYVLNHIDIKNEKKFSFLFILNAIAKKLMPKGLFCYSNPNLIKPHKNILPIDQKQLAQNINETELLVFISSFYKKRWLLLYFVNILLYEKRLIINSLIKSLFKPKIFVKVTFDTSQFVQSSKKPVPVKDFLVDVIIPTLGRKKYLYNVLQDLAIQTIKPSKVIIIEQNPDPKSVSELDFLNEKWPFQIDHIFTHQLGACNARNLALKRISGKWVFFADDDIRFENNLFETVLSNINQYGTDSLIMSTLQKGEIINDNTVVQSENFGTGTSFIKKVAIEDLSFKKEHEHGYGEDVDFGMQIRNKGYDLISFPHIKTLHLKAPVGGFRFKFVPEWSNEPIPPKPSPTVMAFQLKHKTKEQLLGYKTTLFIKFYPKQKIKNPIKYIKIMRKRWDTSIRWAKKLMNDNND